jgi:hypothetical protein
MGLLRAHEPAGHAAHLVCSMWSRDCSDARCTLDPETGRSAHVHPVLGSLHRKALTDCAIPRGCPLRRSVEAETAAAGSYIVPWRTAVVKRRQLDDCPDLHIFLTLTSLATYPGIQLPARRRASSTSARVQTVPHFATVLTAPPSSLTAVATLSPALHSSFCSRGRALWWRRPRASRFHQSQP